MPPYLRIELDLNLVEQFGIDNSIVLAVMNFTLVGDLSR